MTHLKWKKRPKLDLNNDNRSKCRWTRCNQRKLPVQLVSFSKSSQPRRKADELRTEGARAPPWTWPNKSKGCWESLASTTNFRWSLKACRIQWYQIILQQCLWQPERTQPQSNWATSVHYRPINNSVVVAPQEGARDPVAFGGPIDKWSRWLSMKIRCSRCGWRTCRKRRESRNSNVTKSRIKFRWKLRQSLRGSTISARRINAEFW